uniref:DUF4283 domain-containing protein n=1 Tax=Nicotiana tabacum TaxID=4097 RepID=A0A1S4DRX6_TOBAC|nr:PREDICTED: uncharacterized protein LOC107832538 [Nicotiana tabacum]
MGSAPTIIQGQDKKDPTELVKIQAPIAQMKETHADLAIKEADAATAARKLTFSSTTTKPTLAEIVQGNRSVQQGMKLNYYPPIIKDGKKIVRLNQVEVEEQSRRWSTSLIGYVIGGSPQFKEMLKFVYGVWQFVTTPQVLIHDEGYFIFKFESDEDRDTVLHNGPYTFNNRPMILKKWDPDFQMSKENTKNIPVWVNFPELPIKFWTVENLGRIASSIGNPICTDKLTAQEARISYARMLIEMDVSQPLPETILIELAEGNNREQKLSYDWHPNYCQDCLVIGHGTGECRVPAEVRTKPKTMVKNQKDIQQKRGGKLQTKWMAKPKATGEAQEQESNNAQVTTTEEVVTTGSENQEKEEFQVAKSKGKQVQSPRTKNSIRSMSDEAIESFLHQNRFKALRIKEGKDVNQTSKGRVPLAHPP